MDSKKQVITLGDVASYINGYAFKPDDRGTEGLPIIRIQDLTGSANDLGYYNGEYPKKIEINNGDILISWSGSLGIYTWNNGKALLNQHIFKVEFDKVKIEKSYFVYAVQKKIEEMKTKTHGATMKHIVKKDFESTLIPFPSLKEQKEIATKLDKIRAAIARRKEELKLLDDLIKARFVEMFGNPEVICKDWIEKPLGELCEKVIRYPTFYGMEYLESGTRVIRIGNILEDGHMDVEDNNYVFVYNGVNNDFPETVIEINDIIMAVRGDGSAAKRIGIIRENKLVGANISPNLIRIKANHNIDPIYLFSFLTGEVGQKRLGAYVNKTAKKNIAAKDIVKVFVPTPPIEKQREYASFVAQVDKSKFSKIA